MIRRPNFRLREEGGATAGAFALLRGVGQPWLFVVQAVQIAASPEVILDVLRYAAYGDTPPRPLPPVPATPAWVAMYRRHRKMQDALGSAGGLPAELAPSTLLDELRGAAAASQAEVGAAVAELSAAECEAIIRPFLGVPFPPDDATLRTMLAEVDAPDAGVPDEGAAFGTLLASPEGQYYFRVWLPCWILYRDYPPRLLRAARLGNLDALDRLLRLDKYVVHDPGIARVIGDMMSAGRVNDRKRVLNALDGRPTVKLSETSIRAGLAALISQLAFLFHTKVTAPEIQALFDAIERVRTGSPSDPKITATGESWAKAVQRGRTWPSLPTKPPGQ